MGARLRHRSAFAHDLVHLVAAVLLIDLIPAQADDEDQLRASPGLLATS